MSDHKKNNNKKKLLTQVIIVAGIEDVLYFIRTKKQG